MPACDPDYTPPTPAPTDYVVSIEPHLTHGEVRRITRTSDGASVVVPVAEHEQLGSARAFERGLRFAYGEGPRPRMPGPQIHVVHRHRYGLRGRLHLIFCREITAYHKMDPQYDPGNVGHACTVEIRAPWDDFADKVRALFGPPPVAYAPNNAVNT